ncbi:MAG: class II aldolase [Sphaerochaetaceae bacterium]|nr:class II aldolase [Sphaerochaetaceae bacterium]
MSELIANLLNLSHEYGADERFVLLGGGNTSVKDGDTLYVKASGYSLGSIGAEGFVKMSLKALSKMWDADLPDDESEREKAILQMMMDAREEGEIARPSVEALLHALLPERYVVHLHPAIINGLTCSRSADKGVKTYFPDALWVPITNPGFTLATVIRRLQEKYLREHGESANVIFLQNHGVFISADTADGIRASYDAIMETLSRALVRRPDFSRVNYPESDVEIIREALSSVLPSDEGWSFMVNRELTHYLESYERSYPIRSSYTPDHIVYSGVAPLWVPTSVLLSQDTAGELATLIEDFKQKHGVLPKVILVERLGAFANSSRALTLFVDTIKVAVFTESFGGPLFMEQQYIDFIRDWEVENYRAKVAQ